MTIHFGEGGWQIGQGGNGGNSFYVENILELLDSKMEWKRSGDKLYFMPNTTLAESFANGPLVGGGVLETLISVSGAVNVTLRGLAFTHTKITTLETYRVPSCGDWSIHAGGALFASNTTGLGVENCAFTRTGSNAIFLYGKNRDAVIVNSSFYLTGESAIALVGNTNFIDGTAGGYPDGTTIRGNYAHDLGVYGKQVSFVFQALAARTTIEGNIAFDGPRAAINFNDNFGGGSVLRHNLLFNWVKETGDHGVFNSWGRNQYLQLNSTGKATLVPAENLLQRNFIISNFSSIFPFDHDDGSAYYHDDSNFLMYAPAKNLFGHSKHYTNNIFAYADIQKSYGQWSA